VLNLDFSRATNTVQWRCELKRFGKRSALNEKLTRRAVFPGKENFKFCFLAAKMLLVVGSGHLTGSTVRSNSLYGSKIIVKSVKISYEIKNAIRPESCLKEK
jgi:hypothetical protein